MKPVITYSIIGGSVILVAGGLYFGYKFRGYFLQKLIDDENKKKLAELHPKYKILYQNFLTDLKRKGYKPLITSGYRSFEKQQALYNADNRNGKPGYSLHNYAIPIDLNIMEPDFVGMNQSDEKWKPIVEIAKKNGLDWGGEIFGAYKDRVHFQPKGFKYKGSELLAMKKDGKVDKNGFIKIA